MGFVVVACLVMFVTILVATCLMVYATKRHKRYAAAVGIEDDAPPNVHLPSRSDQDQAYRELQAWLDMCAARNIPTWLAGKSRAALLHRHKMYPWEQTITVHYVEPGRGPRVLLPHPPKFLKPKKDAMAPPLKRAQFGPVAGVPYADLGTRVLTPCQKTFTVKRRDVLDFFRYPPSMSDTFTAEVLCE